MIDCQLSTSAASDLGDTEGCVTSLSSSKAELKHTNTPPTQFVSAQTPQDVNRRGMANRPAMLIG